jgi:hypothetical protein
LDAGGTASVPSEAGLLAAKVYEKCDARDGERQPDRRPGAAVSHRARLASLRRAAMNGVLHVKADRRAGEVYGDVVSNRKRFFPGWPVGGDRRTQQSERWLGR